MNKKVRVDLHNHTPLCNHANGEMEEFILRAIEKKIDVYGFSDHAPMEYDPKYRMSFEQKEFYETQVLFLKEKYKDDQIFRFRPRVNNKVNGHFMCDEGRLSYENEATNRFTTALINNAETNLSNTITNMFKELTTHKNILFVLSPNLSLEEMQNVNNLAKKLEAKVSGYSPNTFDDGFKDDYLKTNDKTANRAAFKELEINEEEKYFNDNLNDATLVIIVDNKYFDDNLDLLKSKKIISLFSHHCMTIGNSNIAIPISSFYEKSGTYINTNGTKQKVISKINKNDPRESITTVIEHLKSMIEKGTL